MLLFEWMNTTWTCLHLLTSMGNLVWIYNFVTFCYLSNISTSGNTNIFKGNLEWNIIFCERWLLLIQKDLHCTLNRFPSQVYIFTFPLIGPYLCIKNKTYMGVHIKVLKYHPSAPIKFNLLMTLVFLCLFVCLFFLNGRRESQIFGMGHPAWSMFLFKGNVFLLKIYLFFLFLDTSFVSKFQHEFNSYLILCEDFTFFLNIHNI